MIKMVERWIHRECERDVADLVQPTKHRTGARCAVCGRTFGAVWLNEVAEAVSEPIPATTTGSLEGDAQSTTAEPELEVVAVLEQVLEDATDVIDEKEAEIARLKAQLEALEK